jgi:hypothetical protein
MVLSGTNISSFAHPEWSYLLQSSGNGLKILLKFWSKVEELG